jgi:hypothetical protein
MKKSPGGYAGQIALRLSFHGDSGKARNEQSLKKTGR